jgi:CheY-like chemotaxis protein
VRLAQILTNLLDNAAKYTPDGGVIAVEARRVHRQAAVTVRDNGIGIAPEALPRIFDMFTRERRPGRAEHDGLGIGLSLARQLAELHGGTIDALSAGPESGSEFTVRLPLVAAPHASEPDPPAADALPSMRVLVVDDNEDGAVSLAMVLQHLGADVRVTHDGPSAIEAFAEWQPAVVLLDIGMPGMNGYDVARTIRAQFPDRAASLVALTGWGQDEDRRRAREAGFEHHLVKPAEIDALRGLLHGLARGREPAAGAA